MVNLAGGNEHTAAEVQLVRVEMASEWWTVVVRGVIAIAFGLVALMWPGGALGVLALLLGAFAVASPGTAVVALVWLVGAYAIVSGVTLVALGSKLRSWRPMAAGGLRPSLRVEGEVAADSAPTDIGRSRREPTRRAA